MEIAERLKKLRMSMDLSQVAMSERVGLSKNVWQTYEMGRSVPGTMVYQHLISMGFSADWILCGAGNMLRDGRDERLSGFVFLPFYTKRKKHAGKDESDYACLMEWMAFKHDWLRGYCRAASGSLSVVVAEGDSMAPTINADDLLIFDHSQNEVTGDGLYVLDIYNGFLVKRIRVMVDGSMRIVSDNNTYTNQTVSAEDADNFHVAGRVLWHGKKV